MLFKDVIGQQEVKQHLAEMVHSNRLSHALLFLGKEGGGGLPLALAFAQFLVCEKVNQKSVPAQPGPSLFGFDEPVEVKQKVPLFESCGVCSACTKAQQLVHPDIHYSYPVVTKNRGRNQSPPILFRSGGSSLSNTLTATPTTGFNSWVPKTNREILLLRSVTI
jgi:DNA polymerase-3 subunit delta'